MKTATKILFGIIGGCAAIAPVTVDFRTHARSHAEFDLPSDDVESDGAPGYDFGAMISLRIVRSLRLETGIMRVTTGHFEVPI